MQVPAALLPPVAREEHLDFRAQPGRPGREAHAEPDGLAAPERRHERLAAPPVVDVAVAVVAVDGEGGAVPAREPERRVRRGGEAERERDLPLAAVGQDADLVVYGVRSARGDERRVRRRAVQRRVRRQTRVRGAGAGPTPPDARCRRPERAPEERRREHADVALLDGGGERAGVERRRRRVQRVVGAPALAGVRFRFRGVVGGGAVEAAEVVGWGREEGRVWDGCFPVLWGCERWELWGFGCR